MTSEKNKNTILCFAGRWPQRRAHVLARVWGNVLWQGEEWLQKNKAGAVLSSDHSAETKSNGLGVEIMRLPIMR